MESPLYQAGSRGEPAQLDRTKENLFLKTFWIDLLPHLKWALVCKGPLFRYRIITDEKLKTVFVGAESYIQRPRNKRDDITTFNSLGDLLGADYDLVLIRLGFLGRPNKAIAGALKEALMLRESVLKPTWLIEEPLCCFGPGYFAYSADNAAYIERLYKVIDFTDPSRPLPETELEPVSDVGLNEEPRPEPRISVQSYFEAPLEITTPGENAPRRKSKRWGGRP
jgi:hypothetical protein